jgi:hypothetical protein
MRNLKKPWFAKGLYIILFFFLSPYVMAQSPVTVAVFNESTSMPLSPPKIGPFHPGVLTGSDITLYESDRNKNYVSINISYTFHKKLYQAITIGLNLGYDYKMAYGGSLKTGIGIGYMHTFPVREIYSFQSTEYGLKKAKGNSRFIPSVSFGIGQRFSPNDFKSSELFVQQQYWLEIPYSPGFIPIMSHANTMLGAKFP